MQEKRIKIVFSTYYPSCHRQLGQQKIVFRLCINRQITLPTSVFCWLVGFLTSSSTRLHQGMGPKTERLAILRTATHETELGDHDFCLSQSHVHSVNSSTSTGVGVETQLQSDGLFPDSRSTYQCFRCFLQALQSLDLKVKSLI